jgi:hypothetical protein
MHAAGLMIQKNKLPAQPGMNEFYRWTEDGSITWWKTGRGRKVSGRINNKVDDEVTPPSPLRSGVYSYSYSYSYTYTYTYAKSKVTSHAHTARGL